MNDDQQIDSQDYQQYGNHCQPFATIHVEKMKKTFHYRLRKNLTRRKFTGTQMQNIGIGAHLLPIPRKRKKLSVAICNR